MQKNFGDLFLLPLSLSSSLLKAFVIHSALFVQLENSAGITSAAHLLRSSSVLETVFLDFELPHAAREPDEAIRLVWN